MKLATLFDRSPYLCGSCASCNACPSRVDRYREYRASLDEGEAESLGSALEWMRLAYPPCNTQVKDHDKVSFMQAQTQMRNSQEYIKMNKRSTPKDYWRKTS